MNLSILGSAAVNAIFIAARSSRVPGSIPASSVRMGSAFFFFVKVLKCCKQVWTYCKGSKYLCYSPKGCPEAALAAGHYIPRHTPNTLGLIPVRDRGRLCVTALQATEHLSDQKGRKVPVRFAAHRPGSQYYPRAHLMPAARCCISSLYPDSH